MTRPTPPIPADADLRPLPFMPLHVAKLRDSDLAAECEPEACWYAVLLWCASWHQLPAGSLPDNDTVLCKLIGLGRDLKTWRTHREQALRGWYKCSDGRMYHDVVAAEVVKAWKGRLEQAHRTECARVKKANQRNGTELPAPTFEEFLAGRAPVTQVALSQGTLDLVPEDATVSPEGHDDLSPRTNGNVPRENPSKGERQGEGEREREGLKNIQQALDSPKAPADVATPKADPFDLTGSADRFARLAGIPHTQPGAIAQNVAVIREWNTDGIDLDTILVPIIERFRLDKPDQRVSTLRFFDQSVRAAVAAAEAKRSKGRTGFVPKSGVKVAPLKVKDEDAKGLAEIRRAFGQIVDLAPDKVALSVTNDGETLLVTARSQFVASKVRGDHWKLITSAATAAGLVDVEVRAQ